MIDVKISGWQIFKAAISYRGETTVLDSIGTE